MYTGGTNWVFAQPRPLTDRHQNFRGVSCGGRNHVCQLPSLSFQGFRGGSSPKIGLVHSQRTSPLQQLRTNVLHCESAIKGDQSNLAATCNICTCCWVMEIWKIHGVCQNRDVAITEPLNIMWHVYNPVDTLQTTHDAISNTQLWWVTSSSQWRL